MPQPTQIKCPACGRKQPDRGPTAMYYCDNCGGQFDNEPEEGGSYYSDPTKRIEVEERRQQNRQQRNRR